VAVAFMLGKVRQITRQVVANHWHLSGISGKIWRVDAIDEQILLELQREGRTSITELAERVGLSISPCLRRVRALEASGAIVGYRATVDPQVLGFGFEALVFTSMEFKGAEAMAAFEDAVAALPEVVDAQRLFGEPDYLLRIVATDMRAYQRFYDEQLAALPGVRGITSTIVMKRVVHDRPLRAARHRR
jgi:DNA-binding Lrp family transcriptional regulator